MIVVDIDNTLIKSVQDLGSDLWYNWQTSKDIKDFKLPSYCLFNIAIPLLTRKNTYIPVEDVFTNAVFDILSNKYTTIALTSRSPELRIDTERVLAANGIKFKDVPFETSTYNKFDNKLSYAKGIFMITGQDKVAMLIQLLGADIQKFKYIFFVDDGSKNIISLNNAFNNINQPFFKAFYYPRVELDWSQKNTQPFGVNNGSEMHDEYKKIIKIYGTPDQNSICNCQ